MKSLTTSWGEDLERDDVKPKYPRPCMARDSFINLNGPWQLCINRSEVCESYDREILVPFPPEAPLSGVGVIVQPEDWLHYRRTFTLPRGFRLGRMLLQFGAVDQECEVWVNGRAVGGHRGGYTAFSLDITEALRYGENELRVRVKDRTERAPYARGKQKLVRKGKLASIFYTPCSGIWKTVWLENVPVQHVTGVRFTPLFDRSKVRVEIDANAPGRVGVRLRILRTEVMSFEMEANTPAEIDLPDFKPWSPDDPNIYDVDIRFGADRVRSYFAMRCFEVKRDAAGIQRFFLNNKPFFFNGLLEQGYWPDGLLTAPSDLALRFDILMPKLLGYNTLRVHVKVEEERFYYLCDRLGMVVWQDMPNGGGEYNMFFMADLPNVFDRFGRGVKDDRYGWFARKDEAGREQFLCELEDVVRQLYNHPCIALWTPFNEGWGQFDAGEATRRIRAIDPTRLVNEACGWFDQGGGDLYSIHNYLHRLRVSPKPPRVVALTEYGGYAWAVEDHVACEKKFGYRAYRSQKELTDNYERLWNGEIFPNLKGGLSAAIYTQLSDVEEEVNGVFTYDRRVLKLDRTVVNRLNRRLYEEFAKLAGGGEEPDASPTEPENPTN